MSSTLATTNGSAQSSTTVANWIPVPKDGMDALKIAETLSRSNLIPESFRGKPGDILIVLQMGAEVGLSPMAALQGTAVINGRPAIYGDTVIALARAHPSIISIDEAISGTNDARVATCTVVRQKSGREERTTRSFSVDDAKNAGLWTKAGPWKLYPARMLQMRARGFAIRDAAADILKGLAMVEDIMDVAQRNVTPASENIAVSKSASIGDKLATIAQRVAPAASQNGGDVQSDDPDFSNMKPTEIGEMIASTAQAAGVTPNMLTSIVADFGGKLLKSNAAGVYARLRTIAQDTAEAQVEPVAAQVAPSIEESINPNELPL